ncbi:shieldin complex subunit 2 [Leptodactylus fuscus]|uniref:shieldin complex subunit 2 n=1 Tax=Leptodactylus fuscus TaxID=238119 RepID=UPI003F4E8749
MQLEEMCSKGVIHVFIGAPIIAPALPCGIDRSLTECRTELWEDILFAPNTQGASLQSHRNHPIPDGGHNEHTKHGDSVCDGHYSSGRTCRQESEFGQKMGTDIIGVMSELVSSTELCYITHEPIGRESADHNQYNGEAQDADVIISDNHNQYNGEAQDADVIISDNQYNGEAQDADVIISDNQYNGEAQDADVIISDACDSISAETEFLTVLTSSQLAVQSAENDRTKAACHPAFGTVEFQTHLDVTESSSQEGFSCSSDLFTDTPDEVLDKTSLKSQESESGLLRIKSESAAEITDTEDYLESSSSKRKKAFSNSSPSFKHKQQSKKSKHSPVKCTMNESVKHPQQTLEKSLTLLKHCSGKKKAYNIMVVVLQPCHIKEIKVKSGLSIGSTLPLATIVVIDQSEIKREVLMWRAAAFWSLTLLPGDIIVLTNVSVCEDRWRGDMLLQSSFGSKLVTLGSCSTLHSRDCSHTVAGTAVQELLDYIHKKHYYLVELAPRRPQTLDLIQFTSLSDLQPELLVHSYLKVNSISILKESTYNFKGLQQNKIILAVEQFKGQTSALVLWGSCVSWCDQIQHKIDHIWIFKYLFCKKNFISGDLELHTTPWSSCECLFHDDQRAIDFRKMYNISSVKQMSLFAMIENRYSGEIEVKGRILQMEFHIPDKRKIIISHETLISDIRKSLSDIIYPGCGKCKRELNIDENNVYEQCYVCLPFNQVRLFYRLAQMVVMSDDCCVCVQVTPDILEKMFLNIAPNLLPKVFPSCTDVTYGTIVADLCHSLLAQTGESFVFTIRSQFMLDENSIPLEEDFHLLDFHLDL